MKGAYLKHPLTANELKSRQLQFESELDTALYPARAYHETVEPSECALPDGTHMNLKLVQVGQSGWFAAWGTRADKNFREWLKTQRAQPGDALVFHIEGAKPSRCAVFL